MLFQRSSVVKYLTARLKRASEHPRLLIGRSPVGLPPDHTSGSLFQQRILKSPFNLVLGIILILFLILFEEHFGFVAVLRFHHLSLGLQAIHP